MVEPRRRRHFSVKPRNHKVDVRLTEDEIKALDDISEVLQCSRSETIRRLLRKNSQHNDGMVDGNV